MRHLLLSLFVVAACGTQRGPSGGHDNLPQSGSGPFRLLEASPTLPFAAPRVLESANGDYDHPWVLAHGHELGLWVTFTSGGTSKILHTDATKLEAGFEAPIDALTPTADWEGGSVASPAVVEPVHNGEPWLMFYAANGHLGLATAADGHAWQKQATPVMPGTLPAAVRVGDTLRLYYVSDDKLWAVEAPFAAVVAGAPTWTEIDGRHEADHPGRDPILESLPFGRGIGHVFARAAKTEAGRVRYDLYVTGLQLADGGDSRISGFCASFVGYDFECAPLPVAALGLSSPTMAPDGARDLLFATQPYLQQTVIVVGQSP